MDAAARFLEKKRLRSSVKSILDMVNAGRPPARRFVINDVRRVLSVCAHTFLVRRVGGMAGGHPVQTHASGGRTAGAVQGEPDARQWQRGSSVAMVLPDLPDIDLEPEDARPTPASRRAGSSTSASMEMEMHGAGEASAIADDAAACDTTEILLVPAGASQARIRERRETWSQRLLHLVAAAHAEWLRALEPDAVRIAARDLAAVAELQRNDAEQSLDAPAPRSPEGLDELLVPAIAAIEHAPAIAPLHRDALHFAALHLGSWVPGFDPATHVPDVPLTYQLPGPGWLPEHCVTNGATESLPSATHAHPVDPAVQRTPERRARAFLNPTHTAAAQANDAGGAAAVQQTLAMLGQGALGASPGTLASTVTALANLGSRRRDVHPEFRKLQLPQLDAAKGEAKHLAVSESPHVPHNGEAVPPGVVLGRTRASFEGIEEYLRGLPHYIDQLVSCQLVPGRAPLYKALAEPLHAGVEAALANKGIHQLFRHQAMAIEAVRGGKHVVISTSTSSGKSLVFNVPVFEALLREPGAVALYMFPTKALAQDQLRSLKEFIAAVPALCGRVFPATLDGDTTWDERATVQAGANIILCNPDIIHATVLPGHRSWRRILQSLRFVVLDEAHVYRGVFGSHVGLTLRRLLRVCAAYGSAPQFICCSATIANPYEHFRALVPPIPPADGTSLAPRAPSDDVLVVTQEHDGSAVGDRKFLIWNPPALQQGDPEVDAAAADRALLHANNAADSDAEPSARVTEEPVSRRRRSAASKRARLRQTHDDQEAVRADSTSTTSSSSARTDAFDDSRDAVGVPAVAEATDAVGTALVIPSDYGQFALSARPSSVPRVFNAQVDRDYAARAAFSRLSRPAHDLPGNYRRNSSSAAFRSGRATWEGPAASEAGAEVPANLIAHDPACAVVTAVPNWVKRWREHSDSDAPARRSAIVECALLLSALVLGGMRTIVFCRIRKVAELLLQYTHESLAAADYESLTSSPADPSEPGATRPLSLIGKVKSYRAGYLKSHRRAIEQELFAGRLMGVVATNALELGIDIGSLDAVLMLGYPGSVASLWQQAGRAGRSGRPGIAIMLTYESPVDQHFVSHPETLLVRPPESAHIDVENPNLLRSHVLCAAAEIPISPWDLAVFGPGLGPAVASLREKSSLIQVDEDGVGLGIGGIGSRHTDPALGKLHAYKTAAWVEHPASRVSLRCIDDVIYSVIEESTGRLVDEIEQFRAYWEVHEGAMYMNQGVTYKVRRLDITNKQALVQVSTEQYYTNLRDHVDVNAVSRSRSSANGLTQYGRVQVITRAWGYRKVWKRTGRVFETCDLTLPPIEMSTFAFWSDVSLGTKRFLDERGLDFLGGCHGAGHALIAVLPLFVMCDRADLGTECPSPMQRRARPMRFIVYDNQPGGVGIAAAAFQVHTHVLQAALQLVQDCSCADGCPSCIHDTSCREFNVVLDKKATLAILTAAVGGDITALSLPDPISCTCGAAHAGGGPGLEEARPS